MNWIRSHPDRVAALAAAALLFFTAVLIWGKAASFTENFGDSLSGGAPKPAAPPPKAVELEQATQKLRQPAQWTFGGRSGLFVPEKHFIGANGLPATLQNTEVHAPVPNKWLELNSLPIADADVLMQDPDTDGFTNLEEWQGHTNPTDQSSHPPYVTKLKMKSFTKQTFPLIFSSWVGDNYAINSTDDEQPTQFLKIGDTVKGTRFRIVSFAEKSEPDRFGTDIDVSELTLEHEESKEQVTLVMERTSISPESVANFVYPLADHPEFSVKKDQEFSLKPEAQIKYKLVDVQPDKAVIVPAEHPNERIEIGLFTP